MDKIESKVLAAPVGSYDAEYNDFSRSQRDGWKKVYTEDQVTSYTLELAGERDNTERRLAAARAAGAQMESELLSVESHLRQAQQALSLIAAKGLSPILTEGELANIEKIVNTCLGDWPATAVDREHKPVSKEHLKGHCNIADMVSGHITHWRQALTDALMIKGDPDDRSLIEHELQALEEIEAAVAIEAKTPQRTDFNQLRLLRNRLYACSQVLQAKGQGPLCDAIDGDGNSYQTDILIDMLAVPVALSPLWTRMDANETNTIVVKRVQLADWAESAEMADTDSAADTIWVLRKIQKEVDQILAADDMEKYQWKSM